MTNILHEVKDILIDKSNGYSVYLLHVWLFFFDLMLEPRYLVFASL